MRREFEKPRIARNTLGGPNVSPAGRKIITHYTWGSQPINTRFDRTHTVAGKSHPDSPNPNGLISSHYRNSGLSRLMRAAHDINNSVPGACATWLHAIAAPRLADLRAPPGH